MKQTFLNRDGEFGPMFPIDEPAKQFCEVVGKKMAYSEIGSGPPVVSLHGSENAHAMSQPA